MIRKLVETTSLYILSVACLFSACSTDYFESDSVTSGEREMLSLTVSASDLMDSGGRSSRPSEEGKFTQFEAGDTVGLIVLDKNKNLLVDNIHYINMTIPIGISWVMRINTHFMMLPF